MAPVTQLKVDWFAGVVEEGRTERGKSRSWAVAPSNGRIPAHSWNLGLEW